MLGGGGLIAELSCEILELGAEGGNLACCGVVDLMDLLPLQPAHVVRREGAIAIDLLRDGLCARVKRVGHHGTLDALMFFLVVVLVMEVMGGLLYE